MSKKEKDKDLDKMFQHFIDDQQIKKINIDSFVSIVSKYCSLSLFDKAVMHIVDVMDDWIESKNISMIDMLFVEIDPKKWNEDTLVAILASTSFLKERLEHRSDFFTKVRLNLLSQYSDNEKEVNFVLMGLK